MEIEKKKRSFVQSIILDIEEVIWMSNVYASIVCCSLIWKFNRKTPHYIFLSFSAMRYIIIHVALYTRRKILSVENEKNLGHRHSPAAERCAPIVVVTLVIFALSFFLSLAENTQRLCTLPAWLHSKSIAQPSAFEHRTLRIENDD